MQQTEIPPRRTTPPAAGPRPVAAAGFSGNARPQEPVSAGERLRRLRAKRGITAREVEELSQAIALEQGNNEFLISHGRIIQVENSQSTPSIYKLCSLSAIYGVPLSELVSLFIDLDGLAGHASRLPRENSGLLRLGVGESGKAAQFPLQLDPSYDANDTAPLSRFVRAWGEAPVEFMQRLNLRSCQYGMIGLNDYTLHPLLQPGSFVQIDSAQRKIVASQATNEYNRPIYFLELRNGYVCGWCELQDNRLMVLPHPLSPCKVRVFRYPGEVDVVGRVVAVAARIAPAQEALAIAPNSAAPRSMTARASAAG